MISMRSNQLLQTWRYLWRSGGLWWSVRLSRCPLISCYLCKYKDPVGRMLFWPELILSSYHAWCVSWFQSPNFQLSANSNPLFLHLSFSIFFSISISIFSPECIMHKSTINSILSLFILLWSWLGKMLELQITKFQIRSKGCYTHPVFIPPQTVICRPGSELIVARLLTSSPIVSLSPPSPAIPAWLFLIMYLFV